MNRVGKKEAERTLELIKHRAFHMSAYQLNKDGP